MDIYSGDPYLTLGPDGSTLTYIGGQPVMDQGVENQALISLFSGEGWAGNTFISDPSARIDSSFLSLSREPVTLQLLVSLEKAAIRALSSPIFGRVTVEATNPTSDVLSVYITIQPQGRDIRTIILTRNGINWQAQANNPAHRRV